MSKIERIILRCRDPEAQRAFYCSVLGMDRMREGVVGFQGEDAVLDFVAGAESYRPTPDDLYWKITLAVPNLDLACAQLRDKGVPVGVPEQFGDIGYLAHLKDPEGFTIELIAHEFRGRQSEQEVHPDRFGGGPVLNLLTLRAGALDEVVRNCSALGMKRLAIMPVERFGFTLHFYAFTQETPPSPDPQALENRPWVYQRPYTLLEIQHRPSLAGVHRPGPDDAGFVAAEVSGPLPTGAGQVFGFRAHTDNKGDIASGRVPGD